MAVSYTLLGSPAESLRTAAAAAAAATMAAAAMPTTGDASLDLMDANFNKPAPKPTPAPKKARTENNSPMFVSSGDPSLDFFFHVVPGTPAASVASLLATAWSAEPATALRLACNLRGVRGTGKSDREGFYAAALWMHGCHPATLALNAGPVAAFGYLKDLPEILHRTIHGGVSTRTPGKKARLAALGGFVVYRRDGTRRFVHHRQARAPRRKGNAPRCQRRGRRASLPPTNRTARPRPTRPSSAGRSARSTRRKRSTGTPVTQNSTST
jgi:hypothetical protein